MITAHRYLDLDESVIRIGSLIIKLLKLNGVMTYNELYASLSSYVGENLKYIIIPSIDFLYLLGKIRYDRESDALELLK